MMTKEQGSSLVKCITETLVKENSNLIKMLEEQCDLAKKTADMMILQASLNITTAILTVGQILAEFLPEKEDQNA